MLEDGEAVIKRWWEDIHAGTSSNDGFVLKRGKKSLASEAIVEGTPSLEFMGGLGPVRFAFASTGCADEGLALGAAHLSVLAAQPAYVAPVPIGCGDSPGQRNAALDMGTGATETSCVVPGQPRDDGSSRFMVHAPAPATLRRDGKDLLGGGGARALACCVRTG